MNSRFSLHTFGIHLVANRFDDMPAPNGFVPYYAGDVSPLDDCVIVFILNHTQPQFEVIYDSFNEPWHLIPVSAIQTFVLRTPNGGLVRIDGDGATFNVTQASNLDSRATRALQKAGYEYSSSRQPFVEVYCTNGHRFELDGTSIEISEAQVCPECHIWNQLPRNFVAGNYHSAILVAKQVLWMKAISDVGLPLPVKFHYDGERYRAEIRGVNQPITELNLASILRLLGLPAKELSAYTLKELAAPIVQKPGYPLPMNLPASLGLPEKWWNREADYPHEAFI